MKRPRVPVGVRTALWLALLPAALLLVPWRQTRGIRLESALRQVQTRRANVDAERVELVRRIEQLRSRSRIVRVAVDRLGMHLPVDREIVFLPAPSDTPAAAAAEEP